MSISIKVPPAIEPVTIEEARAQCRVDDDFEDAMISVYMKAARSRVETFLRRSLIERTLTYRLSCLSDPIRLRQGPVSEVLSVNYTGRDNQSHVLPADQYKLVRDREPPAIVERYGVVWPLTLDEPDVVAVDYVAGYGDEADDIPADIRVAILLLIGHLYENREDVITGTTATELPIASRDLLMPYAAWD